MASGVGPGREGRVSFRGKSNNQAEQDDFWESSGMQRASKRMVLSGVPDQQLPTPPGAATPAVLRHLEGPARQSSATSRSSASIVRGYLERVERMRDKTVGSPKRTLFTTKMRLLAGLPLVSLCGLLLCAMMGTAAHAQSAAAWDKRGSNAEARDDFDAAFEA